MTLPRFKWRRLVTLTALLVLATGMAASPLRSAVAPFVTNPLGSWSLGGANKTAAAAPSIEAPADIPVWRANELELAYSATPRYLDYSVFRDNARLINLSQEAEHGGGSNSWSGNSSGSSGWKLRSARGGRSFGWGRWANASSFRGGGSGWGGVGSIGNGSNRGRGNGSVFGEHRGGLGRLTGGQNGFQGGAGPGVGSGTNLASSPEPSTLLLFGTGLATAAGAIRRRLRRR
jgi:hypothetical protein